MLGGKDYLLYRNVRRRLRAGIGHAGNLQVAHKCVVDTALQKLLYDLIAVFLFMEG